jgi:tetratricopeptide (TPR) repeat protein
MNPLNDAILKEMLATFLIKITQASDLSFQQTMYESVGSIDSFFKIFSHLIYSIIQFAVSVILLIFLIRIILWMSREDGRIVIFPFDIQTYSKEYNGKVISDSIVIEVNKIGKIHKTEYLDLKSEKIEFPIVTPNREILDTKISSIGEFSFGGVNIPVGELAMALKQLWPIGGPGKYINGSIQESKLRMRLSAHMDGSENHSWYTESEKTRFGNEDRIISTIKDLSFKIVFDLSKQKEAKNCISFKYFTEALEAYSQYAKTQNPKYLEVASENCINAKNADSNYQLLYSIFYNLGIAYFDLEKYECSKKMFEHSIDLKRSEENAFTGLGASLASLEQYDEALKAFDTVLKISPDNSDALIQKGKIFFLCGKYTDSINIYNKVLKSDPNDSYALYDRACVYCLLGNENDALKDLKYAIENDPKWKEEAKNDDDLKNMKDNESFKQLVYND